jgi:hypothetical protein
MYNIYILYVYILYMYIYYICIYIIYVYIYILYVYIYYILCIYICYLLLTTIQQRFLPKPPKPIHVAWRLALSRCTGPA